MTDFDLGKAQDILGQVFAPWILDLDLEALEITEELAVVRMPFSDRLCREGGVICGQALMSLADTAMVLAVSAASGGYRPMTTVDMSVHFMKPTSNKDVICTARIMRLGRTMAFGHVLLNPMGDDNPIASATTAYALLGPPAG